MPDLDLLQSGPDWNLRPVSANINGPQLFSSERGGMGGAVRFGRSGSTGAVLLGGGRRRGRP